MEENLFKKFDEIGSYKLIKPLGKGGYGLVWLAEEKAAYSSKKFAIKFPKENETDVDVFKNEAKVWEGIEAHTNILPLIKADEGVIIRFPVTVYAIAWSQAVIKYSNEVIELIVFSVKLSNP
jgi:serine/threonine protein kinase